MMRFSSRVAMVTGAGSGIGRATAIRLAAEGAAVAIADIDTAAAQAVVEEIQRDGGLAMALALDIANVDDYERCTAEAARQFGPVDILVNNAAVGASGTVIDHDAAALQHSFEVNIKGLLAGMGVVATSMLAHGGGSIVNVASMGGITGVPNLIPYVMSKGAMVALTRAAAMELAPRIRVNAVAPGKVVTGFRARQFGTDWTEEELAAMGKGYPLQRVGKPEDVAGAIAFLASDDAAWITGVTLPIDGGKTAGFHSLTT